MMMMVHKLFARQNALDMPRLRLCLQLNGVSNGDEMGPGGFDGFCIWSVAPSEV